VEHARLRWLRGQELLQGYESSPGKTRYFCRTCGSPIYAQFAGRDTLVLRVASLDEDPGERPQRRIWTSHEVPWMHYGPELPAYPEWQPGRTVAP
jgi:ADP-ribosyl-[dinitrogen reductase] hydrolase